MEYLVAAIVLSALGIAFVLLRHRRPTGMSHSIGEFEKGLHAIAPVSRAPARRAGRTDVDQSGVGDPG